MSDAVGLALYALILASSLYAFVWVTDYEVLSEIAHVAARALGCIE